MYSPCIHRQYVSSIVCHPTYTLYELLTTWWSLLTTTDHVPAHQVTAPYQTAIQIDLTHNTTLNVSDPHRTNTFYTNLPTIIVISLSVVNSYSNLNKKFHNFMPYFSVLFYNPHTLHNKQLYPFIYSLLFIHNHIRYFSPYNILIPTLSPSFRNPLIRLPLQISIFRKYLSS